MCGHSHCCFGLFQQRWNACKVWWWWWWWWTEVNRRGPEIDWKRNFWCTSIGTVACSHYQTRKNCCTVCVQSGLSGYQWQAVPSNQLARSSLLFCLPSSLLRCLCSLINPLTWALFPFLSLSLSLSLSFTHTACNLISLSEVFCYYLQSYFAGSMAPDWIYFFLLFSLCWTINCAPCVGSV